MALVGMSATAWAEPPAAEEPRLGGWRFTLAPYLWLPGVQGRMTIDGETTQIDQTVGDTLDLLGSLEAGGFMSHVEARKDDLGFFVNFEFLGILTTQTIGPRGLGEVRAKLLEYFVEYGASYRVIEVPTSIGPERPIWVELLAGGRWNRISSELAFSRLPQDSKSKIEFMDPIVGGKFLVPFYGNRSAGTFGVRFRGDIGGFGAGSDLSWSLLGGLQWDTPWTIAGGDVSVLLGYKTYYFEIDRDEDDTETSLALQSGGPIVGVAARF